MHYGLVLKSLSRLGSLMSLPFPSLPLYVAPYHTSCIQTTTPHAFCPSAVTIIPSRPLYVITIPTPTCLYSSLPETPVQTTKPPSFWAQCYNITTLLPYVTTIFTPTRLSGSSPERSVQTRGIIRGSKHCNAAAVT